MQIRQLHLPRSNFVVPFRALGNDGQSIAVITTRILDALLINSTLGIQPGYEILFLHLRRTLTEAFRVVNLALILRPNLSDKRGHHQRDGERNPPHYGFFHLRIHLRLEISIDSARASGAAVIKPSFVLLSQLQSVRDARLLLRANRNTLLYVHGRMSTYNANFHVRNSPPGVTNLSIGGSAKSLSSDIAFIAAKRTPRASAACATAAASISTAWAPKEAPSFAFCPGLATEAKLTSTPLPVPVSTLPPSPAFTTRRGTMTSPIFKRGSSAPAKPAE